MLKIDTLDIEHPESCHDVNCIINGGTGSCYDNHLSQLWW